MYSSSSSPNRERTVESVACVVPWPGVQSDSSKSGKRREVLGGQWSFHGCPFFRSLTSGNQGDNDQRVQNKSCLVYLNEPMWTTAATTDQSPFTPLLRNLLSNSLRCCASHSFILTWALVSIATKSITQCWSRRKGVLNVLSLTLRLACRC